MAKQEKKVNQFQDDPFEIIKYYRKMVNRGVRLHKKRKPKFYPPSSIKTRRMEINEKEISQIDHFLNEEYESDIQRSYQDLPMEEQSLQINIFEDVKQTGQSQIIREEQREDLKEECEKLDLENLFMVNSTQFNDNFLLETN